MRMENLRDKARRLLADRDGKFWELAEVLSTIEQKKEYCKWGFVSAEDYAEAELRMRLRAYQYSIGMWRWSEQLGDAARTWARSQPWSVMRLMYRSIDTENWRQWKHRIDGLSFREVESLVRNRRGPSCLRARELIAQEAQRMESSSAKPVVEKMSGLRSAGMRADEVADVIDMDEEEVRRQLRLVQAFVPAEVWEWMQCRSRKGRVTVGVWLSRWLTQECKRERRTARERIAV